MADYRWIPGGVHYSLLELPTTPMRPRYADERVGYFVSAIKDFSRDTAESFFVRFVNRWRLEKRNPGAAVSEPVKPIVYYIDRTVPAEWRPWVRAGILEWNRAFEEAGLPQCDPGARRAGRHPLERGGRPLLDGALDRHQPQRLRGRPDQRRPPDRRDPECRRAGVGSWIQTWRGESGEYVAPQSAVRSAFVEDSAAGGPNGESRLCSFGEGIRRQGTSTRALLAGGRAEAAPCPAYIGQALKALIMHEVGHTLGLRHNFRGSAGVTRAQLSDRSYTQAHGLGVSVMDYNPPSLSLDPQKQGDFYAPTIGSYDRWAIRYGYTPFGSAEPVAHAGQGFGRDDSGLDARRGGQGASRTLPPKPPIPSHLYGTDEDAGFGGLGLDPTVSRYDQTDDPLGWARERVTLINRLFDSLDTRMVAPGQGYSRLRTAFTDLLTDRWYAMLVTTKYLGGAMTARDHRGDPSARPAFVTVPAAVQREALRFLTEAGIRRAGVPLPSPAAESARSQPLAPLGIRTPGADGRIDFPLHEWAMAQQAGLLGQLLDPAVVSRIRDAELRATEGEPTVTIPELFSTLTAAIWAEVGYPGPGGKPGVPRNVTSVRRDLQRLYLNSLIRMLVNPLPDTPEDARTLARATLAELGSQLDQAIAQRGLDLDTYTQAHLVDSRERITQALNAQMFQNTGLTR